MRRCLSSLSRVEETQGFLPQFNKDLEIPPTVCLGAGFPFSDSRAMPHSCSQLEWRMDFPGVTQEAPLVPHHISRKIPHVAPQLEKNHEILPSSQDEALLFLQGLESNPESSLKTPQEH